MKKNADFKKKECEKSLMKALKLDEVQKEIFAKQRKEHKNRIFPIFDSVKNIRKQLFYELKKENVDSNAINTYINEIAKQEMIIQKEFVNHILATKKYFSSEQFDSLISFHSRAMTPKET